MKITGFLPIVIITLGSFSPLIQDQSKIPGGISLAFKAGNAAELSKYMNSTVEILLLDKEDFYKKNGLLKKLSYIWLAQNALLAVSVGIRNYWYIYYYALAYKRIGVILFLLLTLYGLYSVFVKVRKQKTVFYLLRVNFNTLLILLTLSTLVNWDSYISRFNFAHADRSFVHYDFLSDMSYASLPYLDKSLKELQEIEQSQKERFPTVEQYMQSQEFYDHIQERKSDFISIWKRKSLLEWNLPEYWAYRQLIEK